MTSHHAGSGWFHGKVKYEKYVLCFKRMMLRIPPLFAPVFYYHPLPVHPPLCPLCPSTVPIPLHCTHCCTFPPYPSYPSIVPTVRLHRTHRTTPPTHRAPPLYPPHPVPAIPLHGTHRTPPSYPVPSPPYTHTAHASKKHVFSYLSLDKYTHSHATYRLLLCSPTSTWLERARKTWFSSHGRFTQWIQAE